MSWLFRKKHRPHCEEFSPGVIFLLFSKVLAILINGFIPPGARKKICFVLSVWDLGELTLSALLDTMKYSVDVIW